jgi:ribosomal protein L12E/L44/L45/RPP1/RPP2
VWTRTVNGRALHFYLAGINNQNFLMRDKETGTWWQQINGKAIYGPLKGASLNLVPYDELTFGEWKSEVFGGQVLAEVPKYAKDYESNWEPEVAKLPVVISFPGTALKSRDIVVGTEFNGASRAYPWETLVKQSPVIDHVAGTALLIAVAPDKKSFRVFVSRIDGKDAEFFLKAEPEGPATVASSTQKADPPAAATHEKGSAGDPPTSSGQAPPAGAAAASPNTTESAQSSTKSAPPAKPWLLLDTTTSSEWNFQGCAVSGPAQGKCLDRLPALKDYWFDWRNYHPDTTIYKR